MEASMGPRTRSSAPQRGGRCRRRILVGLGIGLALSALGISINPVAADPGGVEPLRYGVCVSSEATTNEGQGARAYTEQTAPYQGQVRGTDPPGIADERGEGCRREPPPPDN